MYILSYDDAVSGIIVCKDNNSYRLFLIHEYFGKKNVIVVLIWDELIIITNDTQCW